MVAAASFLIALTSSISVGALKYDSISKFFDSVLDGTANLSSPSTQTQEETNEKTPEEEEIERKQEAQRLALLHGGFSDMFDFEEAMKKYGPDFHGPDGYGASLGDTPKKGQEVDSEELGQDEYERDEDLIHRAIRLQREKEEQEAKEPIKECTPKTDGAEQVVLEACTAADHTAGTKASPEPSPTEEPIPDPGSEEATLPLPSVAEERITPSYAEHIKDEL